MEILTEVQRKIDSNKVRVGHFNTQHTYIDISSRQKINKETLALNNTLHQMNVINLYRTFHPKATECTSFSSAHGTFSRTDHMLGY